MNFLSIFIMFYLLAIVVHMAKPENVPQNQEESIDTVMDSPETDLEDSNETPEEDQDMIRQRRKTIDELLRNFQQELRRKEEAASLQAKRSLHAKKKSYANNVRREHENDHDNDNDNDNDLEEEGELPDYRDEENIAAINDGAQDAAESSYRENDKFSNEKEQDNNMVKYDDANDDSKPIQLLKARYKNEDSRNTIKDDNFESNLQDYDDNDEQNVGMGKSPRQGTHEELQGIDHPRKFRYNPSNCCLCGECKDLEKNTDIYIGKEYMRRKARPSYRRYPLGAKRSNNGLRHKNSMDDGFNPSLDNLAHEADYKLYRREQNRRGDKPTNVSRFWPSWWLKKRSAEFNPMHEIKLKTSSRMMQKGYGASLPSNLLADDPPSQMIDNMLQRRKGLVNNENFRVSGENFNDFDTSEENSNAVKNDWNHMGTNKINNEWVAKDQNVKVADPPPSATLRNSQNFTYFTRRKRRYVNGQPSSGQSRQPFRSKLNRTPQSIFDYHRRTKRSTSFFQDPYDEYNEILGYEDTNTGPTSDLLDNDLATINKDVDQYKITREHSQHLNDASYEREKRKGLQNFKQHKQTRLKPNQIYFFQRNGIRAKQYREPATSDTEKYLRFEESSASVNGPSPNTKFDSNWKEKNTWQQKNYARTPYRREPTKQKDYRATKHNTETLQAGLNFKKDNFNSAFFNTDKLNKIIQNGDHSYSKTNRYEQQLHANHARDSGHIRPREISATNKTETRATNQNEEPNDLSLQLRNEILNCTAFASLEQFLRSLPKKYTQGIVDGDKTISATEVPEDIEVELTTLKIEEPITEPIAEGFGTEEPVTDTEAVTETTELPESGDATSEDCLDVLSESSNPTTEPIDGDLNYSEGSVTSWDESTPIVEPPTSSDQVKLNIAIDANIEGNPKDKLFNGKATINVKPGLKANRRVRHMKIKRKSSASGPEKRSSADDYAANDEQLHNDPSSDKLSSNIVRAIFNEVQANPELRVLWPSLKNYQLSDDKISQPDFYSIKNKDNEDQLEQSHELMAQSMDGINNIIDQQARSKACVPLRPDLQEFYDLILELRQRQDMEREKRETLKKQFSKTLPIVDEERRANCKELLQEYETLSEEEQEEVRPMRDMLVAQLNQMETVRRAREMAETSNPVDEDGDSYDNILKLLNSYYTPEYLKLQNANEAYRNITKEFDDGEP